MTGQQTNAAYVAAAEAPMRPLTVRRMRPTERRLLASKLRTSTLPVRLHQRYRIVGEVTRGRTGAEIADRVGCTLKAVRRWLHRFNASGFETFERPTNPWGREPILLAPPIWGCPSRSGPRPSSPRTASSGASCPAGGVARVIGQAVSRRSAGRARDGHRRGSPASLSGPRSHRVAKERGRAPVGRGAWELGRDPAARRRGACWIWCREGDSAVITTAPNGALGRIVT